MNLLRSAFVIARRDFTATVLSRAFLFFLAAPLFPVLLGGLFGGIGARVAVEGQKPLVAVLMSPAEFQALSTARDRLANAADEDDPVVDLVRYPPRADRAAQQEELLASTDPAVRAVLSGGFDAPRLTGDVEPDGSTARELRLILADAQSPPVETAPLQVTTTKASAGSLTRDRAITAQIAQMLLFFLTILLSGMLLSQLIEEKSNKIIEVIAAAVPVDAMFIGKLFAMLAASLVGIAVWGSAGGLAIATLAPGGLSAIPAPAVGWPLFSLLAILYFAMNYLLLGAVFLSIGAQASTVREVQTMSMPVTFAQVIIFGFAAIAVGDPGAPKAIAAAIFPLSSPMVMLARAAELPELWPHLLAIVWQALWVGAILWFGARLFRRTVMNSGPRRSWWKRRPA
jgi:ABC-2 type transport system permease protein